MTRLVTRALALLSRSHRRLATALSASFCDGFVCVRSGGVDGFGEVTLLLENRSGQPRRIEEVVQLELVTAAGRRLQRLQAEARELQVAAGTAEAAEEQEVDLDGRLPPGGQLRLRWRMLLDALEPGEEVRLRGRVLSDDGAVPFETPPLLVGAVLGRGEIGASGLCQAVPRS